MNDVPVRDAATVALLRDGDAGLEVFMLQRSHAAVFSPSAHVFPGGALDDSDRRHDDPFRVAAIRESFEEAGLLLARTATGDMLRLDDPSTAERFALHRKAMITGDRAFGDVCDEEQLTPACDDLVPFGHWVTPVGPPRRFDTRFFTARAPEHQEGVHDEVETIAGMWARPDDVLRGHRRGEIELILPTMRSLETLAAFDGVDDALEQLQ